MELFINDYSLEDQYLRYESEEDFDKALLQFISTLKTVAQQKQVYKQITVYADTPQLRDFIHSISEQKDHSPKTVFLRTLNRLGMENWRNEQMHTTECQYVSLDLQQLGIDDVRGQLWAEVAERQLQGRNCLLLNFPNSVFSGNRYITIIKKEGQNPPMLVNLDWADNKIAVQIWVQIKLEISTVVKNEQRLKAIHNAFLESQKLHEFDWSSWKPYFHKDNHETQNMGTLFPFLELSDLLVENGGWSSFEKELNTLKQEERIGKIEAMGRQIALINGWESSSQFSQRNNRTIYTPSNQSTSFYLAVDTQHGEFEVHDKNGVHLGSVMFNHFVKKPKSHRINV